LTAITSAVPCVKILPVPSDDAPRPLRLFAAIELPAGVRAALSDAAAALRAAGADEGLRWVRPEGIHLTLKFLGATDPARVPQVEDALRAAAHAAEPLTVQPAGIGAFHGGRHVAGRRDWQREPRHHNVRVIWVGVDGDVAGLRALAGAIDAALEPLGFAPERRPYSPHLTLARVRERSDRATRERLHAALEPFLSRSTRSGRHRPQLVPAFPAFRAEQLSLMRSTPRPGGAVYDALASFPLGG
jgi:2'-5' RNA ligase